MRTGALEIVKEVFDPNEVLELIKGIFVPQAEAQNVTFTCGTGTAGPDGGISSYKKIPKLIGDCRRVK